MGSGGASLKFMVIGPGSLPNVCVALVLAVVVWVNLVAEVLVRRALLVNIQCLAVLSFPACRR